MFPLFFLTLIVQHNAKTGWIKRFTIIHWEKNAKIVILIENQKIFIKNCKKYPDVSIEIFRYWRNLAECFKSERCKDLFSHPFLLFLRTLQRLLPSWTIVFSLPPPLTKLPILSPNNVEANGNHLYFSILVVSREWPGHQVLLVLMDFFNVSRDDIFGGPKKKRKRKKNIFGGPCRGASIGVSPPRWAHSFKKKEKKRNGCFSSIFHRLFDLIRQIRQ